ncbi:MAG TPA: hypothetical protein VLA04_01960 [Verrucomicrobiae bacterium]|nr:hypothetical protein [Verrucomicrobiae bacterium]
MSLAQCNDAQFKGWRGPLFPKALEELNQTYNMLEGDWTAEMLDKVARHIEGYITKRRFVTTDGYDWFWALTLNMEVGIRIMVALPYRCDTQCTDGAASDRSIAVYSQTIQKECHRMAEIAALRVNDAMKRVLTHSQKMAATGSA